LDIGVLGYIGILKIRNTLPKSGTFLLGHLYIDALEPEFHLTGALRKILTGVPCCEAVLEL